MQLQGQEHAAPLCWFCGREETESGCVFKYKMRKKIMEARGGPLTRTWFREQVVPVPRCPICRSEAKRCRDAMGLSIGVAALGFLAAFWIGDAAHIADGPMDEQPITFLFIIVPVAVSVAVGVVYGMIGRRRIARNSLRNYPEIRKLHGDGWRHYEVGSSRY